MTMPLHYILVRHGESEGNVAVEASKRGDDSYYSENFVMTPGTQWRLTSVGVKQAQAAGRYLREHLPRADRHFVSPYVRTRMTAAHLGLKAEWFLNRAYREREWGEVEALPRSLFQEEYPYSARVKKINPLYWAPPGGESIAEVAENRVRNILDTLHREHGGETVLAVAHGETMWAHRLVLERWSDEDFRHHDADPRQKIHNCQILWYSRLNPATHEDEGRLAWLQVITPVGNEEGKWECQVTQSWQRFTRGTYSDGELLESVGL